MNIPYRIKCGCRFVSVRKIYDHDPPKLLERCYCHDSIDVIPRNILLIEGSIVQDEGIIHEIKVKGIKRELDAITILYREALIADHRKLINLLNRGYKTCQRILELENNNNDEFFIAQKFGHKIIKNDDELKVVEIFMKHTTWVIVHKENSSSIYKKCKYDAENYIDKDGTVNLYWLTFMESFT